ncbi:hypothetical protein GCM10025868_26570 [Angustibacter aerolatus]|uniref:Uncharacterized protein n=1 Tax=Angustibacter aerolatus TaxID=1162965 RepID=A0ABQ6JKM5_9ACTN|nr:hypothetical protein [Angustibacter aerolatus]GMA87407.1 hypothetical protein GCM10025868_26570 [Angustibacter aerolatus]
MLDAPLYTALVAMALLTTAATGPLLDVVDRRERRHGRGPAQPAPPVTAGVSG